MAEEEIKQVDINGRVYDLQDETSRKNTVYSTTETDTGKKWINGKSIYRKAGIYNNGGTIGTGSITLDTTLTNKYVDAVIATGGSAIGTDTDKTILAIAGYTGQSYRLCIAVTKVGLIKMTSTDRYNNFNWWIEYTKK